MLAENLSTDEKPFLSALAGNVSDKPPCWFMRQAGRYLPEYRGLRADKGGFLDMVYDPAAATEITMQPIRRFGMDAAILFSDILVIPQALGQELWFVQGEGPKLEALKTPAEIEELTSNISVLNPIFETVHGVRAALTHEEFHETTLIGFAGAPWTVACYMINGGGSKDFADVKDFAKTHPGAFAELLHKICDSTAEYLIQQIEAGAEALQIFDSWAGLLDAPEFEKFVITPTIHIVEAVRVKYPDIPIIGFPRMAGDLYIPYARETGVSALGLDQSVDTRWAAEHLQPICPVQGNLDPQLLIEGGEAMKQAARKIIYDLSGGPHIFNLGHGVDKTTPPDHLGELMDVIRGR